MSYSVSHACTELVWSRTSSYGQKSKVKRSGDPEIPELAKAAFYNYRLNHIALEDAEGKDYDTYLDPNAAFKLRFPTHWQAGLHLNRRGFSGSE